jgi:hypothetical protein
MVLLLLFNAAALHYSTIEPVIALNLLTIAYAAGTGYAIFFMPFRRGMVVSGVLSLCVFTWYLQDPPRNDRDWAVEYAIPPTVSVEGQDFRFTNIRDFSYRTPTDPIPAYYDADFRLDQLSSVDLVASHWAGDSIAHIFLTFNFSDGRHLAMSIETRRQERFSFSAVAGFFRRYELFYVVADERDLIGVRTDVRRERVYLYRLNLPAQSRDALFLSYVKKIQELSEHPRWYNTLTSNCTTGILARANAPGRMRFNWRVLLSGFAPEFAYQQGLLDTDVSFAELRQHSLIVRPENAVITDDYSAEIRSGLAFYPAPAAAAH